MGFMGLVSQTNRGSCSAEHACCARNVKAKETHFFYPKSTATA